MKCPKKFQRKVNTRNPKKVFYIFTEGSETEPKYFSIFKTYSNISLQIKKHRTKSHPKHVLKRAEIFLKEESLEAGDQVWLVIDHDDRPEEDFKKIKNWSDSDKEKYHFAISKPCFELWLLLHFDTADKIKTKKECIDRLKKYMPRYEKSELNLPKLKTNLYKAIENGKNKFNQTRENGTYSKVYKIVEAILHIANTN